MKPKTIEFSDATLRLIDQRKLPEEVTYFRATDYRDVKFAISNMVVRGAPAIGATGAYGVYLAALEYSAEDKEEFLTELTEACDELATARPTAVNLTWAINQMKDLIHENESLPISEIADLIRDKADSIATQDIETNKKMASYGNSVIPDPATILTHCNTGALATVGYGTALGVIREAHNEGKKITVYADETRPRLQGARLTAFELVEEGIPATLIVDSVAATLMKDGKIDVILVGADRVASNGDTANKIGTYALSELASVHDVPFYVVAPTSTVDYGMVSGEEIDIEERSRKEVTKVGNTRIAPKNVDVYNPAFDITPAENLTGIITEEGIARPPFCQSLAKLKA